MPLRRGGVANMGKARILRKWGSVVFLQQRGSGDDGLNDVPGNIGEPEVTAGVAVGELFVVESKEVQDGGVKVVNMHTVVNGTKTEFVRFTPCHAAADTATGEERGEAVMVVVASGAIF